MVLRGAGGAEGTYGGRPLVGSEITNLGGGALRPRTTADGGTFGELVPPNKLGVIAALPITRVSRKKRDPVTVVMDRIKWELCRERSQNYQFFCRTRKLNFARAICRYRHWPRQLIPARG